MFFTQDDYKKIQKWLSANAIKDSEFNEAQMPFRGNEIITLVQNNHNVKVFLKDLMSQLSLLGVNDFINLTEALDVRLIKLEEAITLVPHKARKEGQVITFIDEKNEWRVYQFVGTLNQWNIIQLWKGITGENEEESEPCKLNYRIYSEEDFGLFDQHAKVVVIKENVPDVKINKGV